MASAATVFMWIFTIILLIAVVALCFMNVGMSYGWFDKNDKVRRISDKLHILDGEDSHRTVSKKASLAVSGVSILSIIILMIISGTSKKESFKTFMFE